MSEQTRGGLLRQWAGVVADNLARGALLGQPVQARVIPINGPRAGALLVQAGGQSGPLLRTLRRDDCALLRQLVAWDFAGDPIASMSGRYVRLEAGWPDTLAEKMIRLKDLGQHPRPGAAWIAGRDELGRTIVPTLGDKTPHWLIAGQTGSGKSVALRAACLQLAAADRLVLIDGKYGESLAMCQHLRGVVGPMALDLEDARAALGWVCAEMRARYERLAQGDTGLGRLVVVYDEFQEHAGDETIAGLLRKITAQGRGADVHLLAATQHPAIDVFGDASTRRNLVGRIALAVGDYDASKVAVGASEPRADHLLGAGDAYTIAPGAVHRVQCAYVDQADFDRAPGGARDLDTWPAFEAENVGQDLPAADGQSDRELALAILAAAANEGRPTYEARCRAAGLEIGSTRSRRIHKRGRALWDLVKDAPELAAFCERLIG